MRSLLSIAFIGVMAAMLNACAPTQPIQPPPPTQITIVPATAAAPPLKPTLQPKPEPGAKTAVPTEPALPAIQNGRGFTDAEMVIARYVLGLIKAEDVPTHLAPVWQSEVCLMSVRHMRKALIESEEKRGWKMLDRKAPDNIIPIFQSGDPVVIQVTEMIGFYIRASRATELLEDYIALQGNCFGLSDATFNLYEKTQERRKKAFKARLETPPQFVPFDKNDQLGMELDALARSSTAHPVS